MSYRLQDITEQQADIKTHYINAKTQVSLQNQGKQIILCKVLAHIGVKGNKEADETAKKQ